MKSSSQLWAVCVGLILQVLAAASCGGKGGGTTASGLAGLWQATKVEYASSTAGTVDVVANGGSAALKLNADGSMTYTENPQGGAPTILNAAWELVGDVGDLMRVTPAGGSSYWAWGVNLSGDHLSLGPVTARYDVNGDGTKEEVQWSLDLVRDKSSD